MNKHDRSKILHV